MFCLTIHWKKKDMHLLQAYEYLQNPTHAHGENSKRETHKKKN